MLKPLWTALVRTAHPLLFAVGLFGTCFLAWLGYVAAGSWSQTGLGFGWLWFAVLPYLVAWVVLTFRSLPIALLVAAATPFALIGTHSVGVFVGILTFMAFGFPGFIAAGVATGALLFLAQRLDGPVDKPAWVRVHLLGLLPSAVCLGLGFFGTLQKPFSIERFNSVVWLLAAGLAVHAVMTWVRLDAEGRTRVSPFRIALLLVGTFVASGVIYARQGADRSLLAWPWEFSRDRAFRVKYGDRALYAGETIPMRFGEQSLLLRVPEGWRSSVGGWPATIVTLLPETRPGSGITQIQLDMVRERDRLARPDHLDAPFPRDRRWELGCTVKPPAPDGLALCRYVTQSSQLAVNALPFDVLEFNVSPSPHLYGANLHGYFIFGRSVRGGCVVGGGCSMSMPLASGGEARFAFREGELQYWQRFRAEAEALLRAAAGVTFGEYPPFPP